MQIDVTLTREDWYAYVRFISARMRQHRRRWWLLILCLAVALGVSLAPLSRVRGWHFDAGSAFVAIALMYGVIWISSYLLRRYSPTPAAWLGPKRYELGAEGITMQGSMSFARYEWAAIRAVEETDAQLLLMLDDLSGLVIPKRCLAGATDLESVRREIVRLRNSVPSIAANQTSASALSLPDVGAQPAPNAVSRPFLSNVIGGLRLLTFRKVDASEFVPSARQVLLFTLVAVLIWIASDRLDAGEDAFFANYALAQVGWLALVAFALFVLFTPTSHGAAVLGRSSIAAASMLPVLTILAVAAGYFARGMPVARWLWLPIAIVAAIYLFRAKRTAGNEPTISALVGSVAIVLMTFWIYRETVTMRPQFWYSAQDDAENSLDWSGAEEQIYRQPALLSGALAGLAAQDPARTDAYFVGFAGYGDQEVFLREVKVARDTLAQRFDLRQHSLILANSPEPAHDALLASTTALRRSLDGVAQKMDVTNDILMLYITSHGSDEGSVAVSETGMPFNDLYVDDLKSALQESGIQWRVIILSACYSGTFIEPLKDERTIIFTAARADRTSFGCSDERDLTYFGEALFRDALPASTSLLDAFTRTQRIIAKREEDEGLDASLPQLYIGERMRTKLAELGFAARR